MNLFTVLFVAFNVLMLAAALTDLIFREVYDLIWIAGIITSVSIFVMYPCIMPENALCLVFYTAVQEFLMGRVYGRADSHAFSTCALFLICAGETVEVCIFHFGISFVLLTLIQLLCKNIGTGGRLKKKVAMIPYIAVGFWITEVLFLH
jgi:hypothetical protein